MSLAGFIGIAILTPQAKEALNGHHRHWHLDAYHFTVSFMKHPKSELKGLALLFLKLGTTAFGGPAAHVAMMESEVVRKRAWLGHDEFLDMLSATNFIPGPNSTEMAIHIGYKRAGIPGLIIAGACFILPAVVIVTLIAMAYVQYGSLPEAQTLLYGVKPVILAIVAQAIYGLSKSAVKTRFLAALGVASLTANLMGGDELLIIASAGVVTLLYSKLKKKSALLSLIIAPGFFHTGVLAAEMGTMTALPFSLGKLLLFFLKVGSVLFGSGYVLIAFLRGDLVEHWHWLSNSQLLDAIAVGQFTPGPVFTTATFIGYILGGLKGAGVATLGIFLPAFFFVAISAPFVAKLRQSKKFAEILNGVNVASLSVMVSASIFLAKGTLTDFFAFAITLVSFIILLRFKINSAWLVAGGAIIGYCWKACF